MQMQWKPGTQFMTRDSHTVEILYTDMGNVGDKTYPFVVGKVVRNLEGFEPSPMRLCFRMDGSYALNRMDDATHPFDLIGAA